MSVCRFGVTTPILTQSKQYWMFCTSHDRIIRWRRTEAFLSKVQHLRSHFKLPLEEINRSICILNTSNMSERCRKELDLGVVYKRVWEPECLFTFRQNGGERLDESKEESWRSGGWKTAPAERSWKTLWPFVDDWCLFVFVLIFTFMEKSPYLHFRSCSLVVWWHG